MKYTAIMWLRFSAFLLKAFVNRVILRLLAPQYQLLIDLGDLLRADPKERWSYWCRRAASNAVAQRRGYRRGMAGVEGSDGGFDRAAGCRLDHN
jgi:hypothetical protein